MPINTVLPEWNMGADKPAQYKLDEGWKAQEKPPASVFNWFFNTTYNSLLDIIDQTYTKTETDSNIAAAENRAKQDATNKANAAESNAKNASTPKGHIGTGGNSHAAVTTNTNGFMIAADKGKLDTVERNANAYTHPDTHPASMIVEAADRRFLTDDERAYWNAKASTRLATSTVNGLMSMGDKNKLDGIENNANKYIHPSTHPASMIVQDSQRRMVSDSDKNNWNSKETPAGAQSKANAARDAAISWAQGFGLGTVALPISDNLNDVINTGFYRFNRDDENVINEPPAKTGEHAWYYMIVIRHSTTYALQVVWDFNGIANHIRIMNGGNWSAWRLQETDAGAQAKVDSHANRNDNPHHVSSQQINGTTQKSADVSVSEYPIGMSVFSVDNVDAGYPAGLATIYTFKISAYRTAQYCTEKETAQTWVRTAIDEHNWSDWNQLETDSGAQSRVNTLQSWIKQFGIGTQTSIIDWNELDKTGFYTGQANGPNGVSMYFGYHVEHASSGYSYQHVGRGNRFYGRTREGGVWQEWRELENTESAQKRADQAETNAKNASVPRTGGKMTGDLTIEGSSPTLRLYDRDGGGSYPTIMFSSNSGQDSQFRYNVNNQELLDGDGYAVILEKTPSNIQPNLKTSFQVEGNIYTDGKIVSTRDYADSRGNAAETNAKNASVPRAGGTMSGALDIKQNNAVGLNIDRQGSNANSSIRIAHTGAARYIGIAADGRFKIGDDADLSVYGDYIETTDGAQSKVNNHANKKNNPHNVTSEQLTFTPTKPATAPGTDYPKGISITEVPYDNPAGYPKTLATLLTVRWSDHRIFQLCYESNTGANNFYMRNYRIDSGWSDWDWIESNKGAQAKADKAKNDAIKEAVSQAQVFTENKTGYEVEWENATWESGHSGDLRYALYNGFLIVKGFWNYTGQSGVRIAKVPAAPRFRTYIHAPVVGSYGVSRFTLGDDGVIVFDGMDVNAPESVTRFELFFIMPIETRGGAVG